MLTLCLYLLLALTHHAFPYRGKRLLYSYMHTSQTYKLAYITLESPQRVLKWICCKETSSCGEYSPLTSSSILEGDSTYYLASQSIPRWNRRRLYSNVLLYIYFTYYFIYFIYHTTLSLHLVTYPMLVLPYLELPKALQQHPSMRNQI